MFQEWVHEHDAGVAAAGGGEHGAARGGQGPRLNKEIIYSKHCPWSDLFLPACY